MKNKIYAALYTLGMVAALWSAYIAFGVKNMDAALGWFCAGGMAGGAAGAHAELIKKDEEDGTV